MRSVGPESFSADPLRVLRLARMAAELGFTPEPDTLRLASASAPALSGVAAERVFAELRLTIASDRAVAGIELAHSVGATAVVLPELDALRGVEQSDYHHLDVYEHTLATLQSTIDLANDPVATFGELGAAPARRCSTSRWPTSSRAARRCGSAPCVHDIAKPLTHAISAEGRPTFFEHDVRGAEMATRDPHATARQRAPDHARRRARAPPPAARLPRARATVVRRVPSTATWRPASRLRWT